MTKNFIQVLNGEVTDHVPFWLMRQAGRYLPEYRALREKAGSFLDLCFSPDFATEVTLQPLRRYDMDAAILFSDILVIPYALGQKLDFIEGEGPRLDMLTQITDIEKLGFHSFDQKLNPVYEAIRQIRTKLPKDKALIGFAGAPWTLACYMLQGRGDGEFIAARKFSYEQEIIFAKLIEKLVKATTQYLLAQIKAGVDVVQIFDSWAGLLPSPLFEKWVITPTQQIVTAIHNIYPDFPVIGFPRGAGALYMSYAEKTGIRGIGLDQQVPLEWAKNNCPAAVVLQGNLDPVALLTGGAVLQREAQRILQTMADRPFIFNLGHGVMKETPPEHIAALAQIIRDYKSA